MLRISRLAPPVLAALLAMSCVDLQPDPAPPTRWLSLGSATMRAQVELPPPVEPRLFLARVVAAESIGDRLIRRRSEFEVAYDDYSRWIDPPERAVERALEDELFRRRGFQRAPFDGPRQLEVEVVRFEESIAPRRESVVAILARLTDADGATLVDRLVEARSPVDGDDPALVARAMSVSLDSVVMELSDLIATK